MSEKEWETLADEFFLQKKYKDAIQCYDQAIVSLISDTHTHKYTHIQCPLILNTQNQVNLCSSGWRSVSGKIL